jgi:RNA polymerase sigma-70 factor (ECF subfamily)
MQRTQIQLPTCAREQGRGSPARPNTDTTDRALMARIAAGDERALEMLYGRHHLRTYRFVLRLLGNECTAEDVVSEVFFHVWRHAGAFEGRSEVSTWLLGIARFKALSTLRVRSFEQLDEEAASQIVDDNDTAELALIKSERSEMLQRCLAQLAPAQREVIDLVYYHGKSVTEVAEIVGISPNTVKTRMFYARKKLGEAIQRIEDKRPVRVLN